MVITLVITQLQCYSSLIHSCRMQSDLPHYATGEIIKGFGRGSKQLGIPTANFSKEIVDNLPKSLETGVYFGFSKLDDVVYKMVMSIGWNPFFNNEQRSMETHIIHNFDGDLYGKELKVVIVGHLRPQKNFDGLQSLIDAINEDIRQAKELLDTQQYIGFKDDPYFK